MNDRPVPPRRARPMPPAPRRQAVPAAAQNAVNPFAPAVQPPEPANPFLTGASAPGPEASTEVAGSQGVVTSAASVLSSSEPVTSAAAPPAGMPAPSPSPAPAHAQQAKSAPSAQLGGAPAPAPTFPQRGMSTPQVKDPHAAFRKGSTLKPAFIGGAAVAMLAGLFFLMPSGEDETASSSEAAPVIGASVSPEIIPDPDASLGSASVAKSRESSSAGEDGSAASASPGVRPASGSSESQSGEFAQAFKSSAQR